MSTFRCASLTALLPLLVFGCAGTKDASPSIQAEDRLPVTQPAAVEWYDLRIYVWAPEKVGWALTINYKGYGWVGTVPLPESYFPEGTFSTVEVVRKLMPTLRAEGGGADSPAVDGIQADALDYGVAGGNPYLVVITSKEGRTRYYPTDFEAVAALFDAVRPHMTLGDLEKLEMHPPPGLPLPEAKWEDVAAELSRSTIEGLPDESRVMTPNAERIKRSLVQGRPISRDAYRPRHSINHVSLSAEARTPDGKTYQLLLTEGGLGLVRTPDSEVILLDIDLPTTRPAE